MSDLPNVTGDEACSAFGTFDFQLDRVRGSHHILKKSGHANVLSVPIHGKKPLRKGTLRSLIRDAGMTVEEFVAALK